MQTTAKNPNCSCGGQRRVVATVTEGPSYAVRNVWARLECRVCGRSVEWSDKPIGVSA